MTRRRAEPGATSVLHAHIEATLVDAAEFRRADLDASRAFFTPKPDDGAVRLLLEEESALSAGDDGDGE